MGGVFDAVKHAVFPVSKSVSMLTLSATTLESNLFNHEYRESPLQNLAPVFSLPVVLTSWIHLSSCTKCRREFAPGALFFEALRFQNSLFNKLPVLLQ